MYKEIPLEELLHESLHGHFHLARISLDPHRRQVIHGGVSGFSEKRLCMFSNFSKFIVKMRCFAGKTLMFKEKINIHYSAEWHTQLLMSAI